jgi:hypothetical protein
MTLRTLPKQLPVLPLNFVHSHRETGSPLEIARCVCSFSSVKECSSCMNAMNGRIGCTIFGNRCLGGKGGKGGDISPS